MKKLMLSGLLGHYALHSMSDSDRGATTFPPAHTDLGTPTTPPLVAGRSEALQQEQGDYVTSDIGQMTQGNTGKQTVVAPQQGGMPDISAGPGIGVSEWHDGPPAAGIDPNQADMQYS